MSRAEIFENIFTVLNADSALVPGLLGPRTTTNQRLYRAFPQAQSLLTGYEPQGGEGWLVLQEIQPGLRASNTQMDTIYEVIDLDFNVFVTRYSLADDVTDFLDTQFHWTVEQQRDVQFSERFLLFARRFYEEEKYLPDVKLYNKIARYRLRFVVDPLIA